MYPGVTLKALTAVAENDKMYPTTVTQQINFTDGDVFNRRADICWLIYGKFRDNALDAIFHLPATGKKKKKQQLLMWIFS